MVDDYPSHQFVLTPNRSLSTAALAMLFAVFGAISFGAGLAFYAMGAWPVVGFLGLDVALLVGAFHLSNRQALRRQIIAIEPGRVEVVDVDPRGRSRAAALEAYWARVEFEELAGGVCQLRLTSRGRSVAVGGFLSDPERRRLATAVAGALRDSRSRIT